MNNIKNLILGAAVLLGLLGLDTKVSAQPMSGTINQDGWSFTWDITSTSGIRITNVHKNGVKYLHNGSLPGMRVQYNNNACGPFLDRIKWDNIVPDGNGNKVRVSTTAAWIRVWVQAQLGSYNLQQSWWFNRSNGQLVPEIASSGLQCPTTHRHHPYWRLDFDIFLSSSNFIQTIKNGVNTDRTVEVNLTKASAGNEVVVFRPVDLTMYAHLQPGSSDGVPDSFSNWDYGLRRYPSTQNDPYAPELAPYTDPGDLEAAGNPRTSANGEAIGNQDVVVWYAGHLAHDAALGGATYLYVGPWITFIDN